MDLEHPSPICVIGLGNLLERDDGVGPRVVQELERRFTFPREVELVDIGTAGLHLLTWIIGRDVVIFVDAVTAGGTPGALYRFERARLLEGRAAGPRISQHQPEIREILALAEVAGGAPREVVLLGVEPEDLRDGIGLTRTLEAALEPLAQLVVHELERLGVRAQPHAGSAATLPAPREASASRGATAIRAT